MVVRKTCGSCVFYKDDNDRGAYNSGYGICRRYPENVKTNDGKWCGEYKATEKNATPPPESNT